MEKSYFNGPFKKKCQAIVSAVSVDQSIRPKVIPLSIILFGSEFTLNLSNADQNRHKVDS